ncbi:MAG: BACON domain-containing protein [Bacteroidales bacterium]|uniref:BACON domain-containing protein n=1 Tax=Porphyromonas sp. TaxID=1924944 RepID=UPI002970A0F6|nr:BACON domain-containing protein [Porphyromonas sp.]MDD7438716.1 BACON domain-containing protein [Bacteroidales bacterium]MDY3066974.1 BACON domain-containing protein [Porphyromonas sp.]
MKKINGILIVLWTAVLALSSCQRQTIEPDHFLISSTPSVTLRQLGGTHQVTITASSERWTYDSDVEWLKLSKSGNILVIAAEPNNNPKERVATVTVMVADQRISKSISVVQFGSDPALIVEQEDWLFDNKGKTEEIPVISNATDWTVTLVDDAPWLSYQANQQEGKLVLTIAPLPKDDSHSTENRRTKLILSNETKHVVLSITQTGWVLFSDVLFGRMDITREEIIRYETEKGHTRFTEYEDRFNWVDEYGWPKPVVVFKTDAIESVYAIYKFDVLHGANDFQEARIQAAEGQVFSQEEFDSFVLSRGYKKVHNDDPQSEFINYYQELEDRTNYVQLKNKADAKDNIYDLPGAYAKFGYDPSNIVVKNNIMQNFPVRNLQIIHNVKYKLEEIIAYEAQQGMVPDYNNPQSIKSTISGYEHLYESLVFQPEAGRDNKKEFGDLYQVTYFFNIPGYRDPNFPDKIPDGHVDDEKFAGTAAHRVDTYVGAPGFRVSKEKNPAYPYWGDEYDYRFFMLSYTYELANRIGFITRFRGTWDQPSYFQRGDDLVSYAEAFVFGDNVYSNFHFLKDKEMLDKISGKSK